MRSVAPTPRRPRRARLAGAALATAVLAGPVAAGAAAATAPAAPATRARAGARTGSPVPGWVARAARWHAPRATAGMPGRVSAAAVPPAVPAALAGYLRGDRTDLQWPLRATGVERAWTRSRGEGVVVATIDTGVDVTAPDLAGQLLPGGHLTAAGTVADGTGTDRIGHGTHVAGIVAGTDDGHGVTGVAPEAKVLPVDVDAEGLLTGAQVAAGIAWAVGHGARVVNLSLGFDDVANGAADVAAICRSVGDATDAGVVVVAAAGNDGDGTNEAKAPADCPGAISVAALDADLRPAPWSSYDGTVTLAAPGTAVWSSVPATTSPLRWSAESGTSMAAPFVSGVAALLLARHPDWTPAEVARRLVETAQDVAPAGPDPRTGAGVVDPAAALDAGGPGPQPVPVLTARADPYASRVNGDGFGVFDRTEVHWVPDPAFAATGYRVTRWTAAGTTTTAYPAGTVRAVFPAGPAGYQVTAVGPDGEVPSAPLWFPLAGQDYTPLYPVTGLTARWTAAGGLVLRWSNPVRNRDLADQFAVLVGGDVVLARQDVTIPSSVTLPASAVPGGDLEVAVLLGSGSSNDIEESRVAVRARVPFSGEAVGAGRGYYRVDLALAASRRPACGGSRCTGAAVTVTSGRTTRSTRLDARGHAVVVVPARPSRGLVTVAVTMGGRKALTDRALRLAVS